MLPDEPDDHADRGATPAASSSDPDSLAQATLRVTGLASGGEGVGRLRDGRVVFVEDGVPGDLIELADARVRKNLIRARVGRILEASPDRVDPRCSHFARCGGCRWQHVRYEAQLEAKRIMIRDALQRIGGLELDRELEIVASPDPYGYRARARLVESEEKIGYRARGERSVVAIEECPVLVPAALKEVVGLIGRVAGRERGVASDARPESNRKRSREKEWVVSVGLEGSVALAKVGGKGRAKAANPSITIEVLGESLRISSRSFMQGNALLIDALAEEVMSQCTASHDERSPARFVELYAGAGFFTRPLARRGLEGVAIESDPSAVSDLAFNLRDPEIADRVRVLSGRVESRRDLAKELASADVLLVDPPRIGLGATVRDVIGESGPPRLVYVSCDPATLARDLKGLLAAGYALSSLRALDLFPQTPHVEVVARLERAGPRAR